MSPRSRPVCRSLNQNTVSPGYLKLCHENEQVNDALRSVPAVGLPACAGLAARLTPIPRSSCADDHATARAYSGYPEVRQND